MFNIKENIYNFIQTIYYHTEAVYKIIEFKNKYSASYSDDQSIIFYIKDNNEYIKYYHVSTNSEYTSVLQINDNEICYY